MDEIVKIVHYRCTNAMNHSSVSRTVERERIQWI